MTKVSKGCPSFARDLFALRWERLRLPQRAFAARYGVTPAMMKDQEQARFRPHPAFMVLVAAIELDPAFVAKAARLAEERWGVASAGRP